MRNAAEVCKNNPPQQTNKQTTRIQSTIRKIKNTMSGLDRLERALENISNIKDKSEKICKMKYWETRA